MPRKTLETAVGLIGRSIHRLVHPGRTGSAEGPGGARRELSPTEATIIARLAKDGPATNADLARTGRMKVESLGAAIAALEAMGMVERNPYPPDGDKMTIGLTAAGSVTRNGFGPRPLRPARIVRIRPRHGSDPHGRAA